MRVSLNQRQTVEHNIIHRALGDRTIVAREPGLINLPLPLPSVPVISPLLSPIVGGSNNGNQNSNTGTTTAAAPSTPTSSNGNGNNGNSNGNGNGNSGGNNGGNNGGSSGGDTGGSSSSSSSSSSDPSGGSSSGTTSPSGGDTSSGTTSSGTSSSSGGTTSSGDSSSSSSGASSGGSSGSSSGTTTTGTTGDGTTSANGSQTSGGSGGSVLSSNGTVTGGGSGSSGTENSGTSSSLDSSGNVIPGGVANVGKSPSGGSGTTGTQGTHSVGGNGSPGSTNGGTGVGGDSSGVGGLSNGSGSDNQGGGKHGLSGGAKAGVAICLLALVLACIIFFIRRRTRSRRNERSNRWWFSRRRVSQTYGDRNSKEILPSGAQTARSSFATTVDRSFHSNPPSSRESHFIIPPLPPMAEVGRASGTAPQMVIDTSYYNNTANDSRFSIGSGTSDNHSQYLLVNRDSMNPELGTPMSVRPFSPSESFAFPKPPDPTNSRPSSSATLAMLSPNKTFQSSGSVPPTPGLPTLNIDNNPINNVTDPFLDNNPFDDPNANSMASGSTGKFAEVEFICRPFHPTLPDELSVRPQDPVRVLQVFDDGWALVEKVRLDDPNGKRKDAGDVGGERGLIPIDCLRAPGQELPDFFAAKRVSSYAGSGFQAI